MIQLDNVLNPEGFLTTIWVNEKGNIDSLSREAAVKENTVTLRFEDAIVFPGLINSHDHLDFNSFPAIGNRIYDDYRQWGENIHIENSEAIQKVLAIPKELRVQWSLYKHLLNGFTTVVQHGEHFNVDDKLVDVFQDCISVHSTQEKNWKLTLSKPTTSKKTIVMHIGEGTNSDAAEEIDDLIKWNLFKKNLIGIHGVSMTPKQAKSFKALVWCPDANYFLLGKTADIPALKKVVPIIFGTDSTLTANWNIWEQMRIALQSNLVTEPELYDMLTLTPAKIWGFKGKGDLHRGAIADIVVAKKKRDNFLSSFYSLNPEDILLVMRHGKIRMFDQSLFTQLQDSNNVSSDYSKISLGGCMKYVYGDLPHLIKSIQSHYPALELHDITTK